MHATQVIGKHVFYLLILCGNNLYTFITGDSVKWYIVEIIVENNFNIRKYYKMLQMSF